MSNSSEAKLETVRNLQHFKFASNLLFELQKSRWHPIILLAGWYGVLLWAIIIPLLECSPLQINEPRIFLWLICLWDIYFLESCSSDSFFNVFVMSSSFLGMAEFGWCRLLLTWDVGSLIIKLDGKRFALIQDFIIMTRAEIIAMKVCSAKSREILTWRAAKAPLDLLQLSGQDLAKATRPNRLCNLFVVVIYDMIMMMMRMITKSLGIYHDNTTFIYISQSIRFFNDDIWSSWQ